MGNTKIETANVDKKSIWKWMFPSCVCISFNESLEVFIYILRTGWKMRERGV